MKVGEFMNEVANWLDSHQVSDTMIVGSETPIGKFLIGFEYKNRDTTVCEKKFKDRFGKFTFVNRVTSSMNPKLSVVILTEKVKGDKPENTKITKVIGYIGLKNMYNGFIEHANKFLTEKYGRHAILREYYTPKGSNTTVNVKEEDVAMEVVSKDATPIEKPKAKKTDIGSFELSEVDKSKLEAVKNSREPKLPREIKKDESRWLMNKSDKDSKPKNRE